MKSRTPSKPATSDKSEIKRCAIYTRKSNEEGLNKEHNTLQAQRERAENYILSQSDSGWRVIPENYDDGGFSGGNIERPALKRMMDDIQNGRIDIVVVYKVDRISRSLMDFYDLLKIFEKHGVEFVSVTQNFDTSQPMGKLMLNMLLSFAQFEREVIRERILDKFELSKQKGIFMGGSLPLGYRVEILTRIQRLMNDASITDFGFEELRKQIKDFDGFWKAMTALEQQRVSDKRQAFIEQAVGRLSKDAGDAQREQTRKLAAQLFDSQAYSEAQKVVEDLSRQIDRLSQALSQQIVELYTPDCRADLGDTRCKVNLAALTVTGAVTAVTDRRSFSDSARGESVDYWNGGLLTWTSGANVGRKMEVKAFASGGAFTLFLPMPSIVAVGDNYSLRPGCDKKFSTCKDRYSNVKNFRGEPNVPGNDQVLAYPDGK